MSEELVSSVHFGNKLVEPVHNPDALFVAPSADATCYLQTQKSSLGYQ